MSNNRNYTIDLFKYISALLVVAIHTSLFVDINDDLYFYTVGILCRIAVPFFAICTGYYLGKKYKKNNSFTPFINQWKKLFQLYLIWSLIYLLFSIPMWIEINWFSIWSFVDYGIGALIKGSHYHLWYVLSMIYAIPVLYLIVTKINPKQYLKIAILLYFIKAIMYGYNVFLPSYINEIFIILNKVPGITDALFCILPLMLIGFNSNFKEYKNNYSFVIYFILWIIEAKILKLFNVEVFSYLICTLPTGLYLFEIIKNFKLTSSKISKFKFSELSLYVYCIHPIIVELLDKTNLSSIELFLIVVLLSTILGWLIINLKERISVKH